jgi:hypothetical protein
VRKADESNAIGSPTFGFRDHPRPSRVNLPRSTPMEIPGRVELPFSTPFTVTTFEASPGYGTISQGYFISWCRLRESNPRTLFTRQDLCH